MLGSHNCFLEITDQIGSGSLPQNDTAMLKMKEWGKILKQNDPKEGGTNSSIIRHTHDMYKSKEVSYIKKRRNNLPESFNSH